MFVLQFFRILIFGFNSGVKGQKMAQKDKKYVCRTPLPQEASFFQNWFFGFLGGEGFKGQKSPIITNFSLPHSISLEL